MTITFHADGEANTYTLMRAGKWLARVLMNGELLVAQQEAVLASLTAPTCEHVVIDDAPKLDQINVFLQDTGPGAGRITIECYGQAWSAYFGGMGGRTIRQFVAQAEADYLSIKLAPAKPRPSVSDMAYLLRVTEAVIKAVQ